MGAKNRDPPEAGRMGRDVESGRRGRINHEEHEKHEGMREKNNPQMRADVGVRLRREGRQGYALKSRGIGQVSPCMRRGFSRIVSN